MAWWNSWATSSAPDGIFQKSQNYFYIDKNIRKLRFYTFFLYSFSLLKFLFIFVAQVGRKTKNVKTSICITAFTKRGKTTEQQKCIKFNVIIRDVSSKNF